jgi:Undecaprenyl-phosphate galactose phosphotransferase WbaP
LATQQANEAAEPKMNLAHARVPHTRPHLVSTNDHPVRAELEADERMTSHETALGLRPPPLSAFDSHAGLLAAIPVQSSVNTALKRVCDVLGALALGMIFSPLMFVILLFMRREGGPVIYRHRRVGRNGRVFECLKFRTMVPNAEQVLRDVLEKHPELKAEWLRDHKLRNDPRVTALGRFLRRTSLDELPQLWNVVRGEMSLVGPRPVVREELMRYGRNLRVYLSAKPGITGLWQVMGRNDTDYRRRVAMDVCYVRNQNLLLDLYILLKTTRVVLGGGGAY